MPEYAAELEDIRLQRGDVLAVDNVNLRLPWGKATAVLGASGSGKSSLIQLIIGLLRPSAGRVRTLGEDLEAADLRALRRRIGYAIQDVALLPHMKIRQNILLPAILSDWAEDKAEARLDELLDIMSLPASLLQRYPHQLSGGQQQRAGICRALILNPDLLLLDEPFSGLDTMTRRSIHSAFLKMREKIPVSTVLVTHDPEEAVRLADYICVMRQGQVQQFDSATTVMEAPANDYVRDLCTGITGAEE